MEAVWDADDADAVVCVHPGWPMLRGRAAVLRSWSAVMANTDYIQFFITDLQVSVTGADRRGDLHRERAHLSRRGGERCRGRDQRVRPAARRLAAAGAPRLAGARAARQDGQR